MGCSDKVIPNVPIEDGALVLRGRGCNPDVRVPVGISCGATPSYSARS